jgi:hypothetical protein
MKAEAMTRLTLQIEDLVVSSFATQGPTAASGTWAKLCTADISTCPRTGADACICTADISTCPRTSPDGGCVCTADISTCPRTGTCYGTNAVDACIAIDALN